MSSAELRIWRLFNNGGKEFRLYALDPAGHFVDHLGRLGFGVFPRRFDLQFSGSTGCLSPQPSARQPRQDETFQFGLDGRMNKAFEGSGDVG